MPAALQLLVLAAGALQVAAYSPTLNTTKFCGVSEAVSVSTYTLINNIWGPKLDNTNPKGFQCGQFTGRNGNTSVSWNINYQWTLNKGFVKGYTNMQQNQDVGHRIYNIYKIPAVWNYTVNVNSNLDYNVAYDFYTAKSADLKSPYTNEIMVWLSSQYAKPTSSHFNASNKSVPIFSNILLNGYTWDLYQGVGGTGLNAAGLNVLSFYNNGPARTNFKGDMKLFLNYLISKKLIVGTDFLNVVGGGSEVIKADNTTIKSSYYSVDVIPNLVFQSSTVAPPPSSSVKSTSTAKVSSTVKPASSSTKKSSSSVKVSSTVKATSTAKTTAKVTSSTKKSSSSVKATSTVKK